MSWSSGFFKSFEKTCWNEHWKLYLTKKINVLILFRYWNFQKEIYANIYGSLIKNGVGDKFKSSSSGQSRIKWTHYNKINAKSPILSRFLGFFQKKGVPNIIKFRLILNIGFRQTILN